MKFNLSLKKEQYSNPIQVILNTMLLLILSGMLSTVAFGRDYHVSASATGDGKGGDRDNFCLLSYANDNIRPGETAYLYDDEGIIVERIAPDRNGNSGAEITYQAANGESPVLSSPESVDGNNKRSATA